MSADAAAIAAVLDALIPPHDELPGGSIAAPALLANADAARVLDALPANTVDAALQAWEALAKSDPYGASAVQHLLSGAYFADPHVRAHYGIGAVTALSQQEAAARRERQQARLADLLTNVPRAPRLPERNPA